MSCYQRFEVLALSHSASFDHRRRPEALRTAMAMAFFCPNQNNQPLTSGDAGVEKVPLQHGVMLSEHRDNYCGISDPWLL